MKATNVAPCVASIKVESRLMVFGVCLSTSVAIQEPCSRLASVSIFKQIISCWPRVALRNKDHRANFSFVCPIADAAQTHRSAFKCGGPAQRGWEPVDGQQCASSFNQRKVHRKCSLRPDLKEITRSLLS